MRLDLKKVFTTRSERVKSCEFHPTEPWMLLSLFTGQVQVYDYNTKQIVKSFEITELPVRIARFIPRKSWIVTGSDDMCIRVFNYDTLEKVKTIENAHMDYIRYFAVHPTLPLLLSCSDDMTIRLWNWDTNWTNVQVFEGHSHYVMQVAFNPKDTNTFASASLDKTVKVWSIGSPTPNFTLEGHKKGVNCVSYYPGGEKPYLASGSDEGNVKIWDYQTKSCISTLEGHSHNVSMVLFHPVLPLIISASEDSTVKLWQSNTYRLETTLQHNMERAWALATQSNTTSLLIGYDTGTVLMKLGREETVASMDNTGKIVVAKNNEILQGNLRSIPEEEMRDGDVAPIALKSQCNTEVFPQEITHNPNGRFVSVVGDGEYIIYTALAWRNKSFGQGKEVVWSLEGEYAARETHNTIKIFNKNFKEKQTLTVDYTISCIYGGAYLGVAGSGFLSLYDWDTLKHVRRIDVEPRKVFWSETADMLSICTEESLYILKCNRQAIANALASGEELPEEGLEEALDVMVEKNEIVTSAAWVGDCFLYVNTTNRACYIVGQEVVTIAHLDRSMLLLGYVPAVSRVVLIDKNNNIVTYTVLRAILEYQTLVLRGDQAGAQTLIPSIPKDQRNRIARFLDSQGLRREALELTTDSEHRFDLAVQIGRLDMAKNILEETPDKERWNTLADVALSKLQLDLAEEAMTKAGDLAGLLLLYSSLNKAEGLTSLYELALKEKQYNVAFLASYLLGDSGECVKLLMAAERYPEAAIFARTYSPASIDSALVLWREALGKAHPKIAQALASPSEYPNLFPGLEMTPSSEY